MNTVKRATDQSGWPTRWLCDECDAVIEDDKVLSAPNPFDGSDHVTGCPNCAAVNSLVGACAVCGERSSIGTPTERGYGFFCHRHYTAPRPKP